MHEGIISLDALQQVVAFNEVDQTITVSGYDGPKLEDTLNSTPRTLGAKRAYTCGHFPQRAFLRGGGSSRRARAEQHLLRLHQRY
ncbi:MAG: hypothetical protein ACLRRT_03180 [Ruthenibacterium lactatiformans]